MRSFNLLTQKKTNCDKREKTTTTNAVVLCRVNGLNHLSSPPAGTTASSWEKRGTNLQPCAGMEKCRWGRPVSSQLQAAWLAQLYYFSLKKLLDKYWVINGQCYLIWSPEVCWLQMHRLLLLSSLSERKEWAGSCRQASVSSSGHEAAPMWVLLQLGECRNYEKECLCIIYKLNNILEEQDVVWILVYERRVTAITWINPLRLEILPVLSALGQQQQHTSLWTCQTLEFWVIDQS